MGEVATIATAAIFFTVVGILLSIMILVTRGALVKQTPCRVVINDEVKKELSGGTTLLQALLDENIGIPSPCGGKATCHQCKLKVLEGGGEPLETETSIFSPKEIKEGWRLSCQCKLKEDMKLSIPPAFLSVAKIEATVTSNENVATFIKELVVSLPEGKEIEYIPGDYMQVHIPAGYETNTNDWKETIEERYYEDWEKFSLWDRKIIYKGRGEIRAYSMASYPAEKGVLKFNIRIASPPIIKGKLNEKIAWGIASSYLFSLKKGDKLTLSGPYGESHMKYTEQKVYFLTGGAGSSFTRSHVFDFLLSRSQTRPLVLWYGARSIKENIYEEDFKELEKKYDNFTYHIVLSEPTEEDIKEGWPKDDPVKTNFLYLAFKEGELDDMEAPEDHLYYVCGPPLHNKSIMELLDNYGVPRENIVLDDFGN